MGRFFEDLTRDALAAQTGDHDALLRIARRGVPALARHVLPPAAGPIVDAGAALYDHVVRPGLQVPRAGSYTTPGAREFTRWLLTRESGFFLIFGAPGTGKTSLACAMADRWTAAKSNSGVQFKFLAGVHPSALRGTPLLPFDLTAHNVEKLPKGSILIIPDAAFEGLDARDHGTDVESIMRELVAICRHRHMRVIVDSQSTSLMSKSLFIPAAVFVRPLGVTWEIAERPEFLKLGRHAMAAWATIPAEERLNYVYAICDACGSTDPAQPTGFKGFIRVRRPDWYSHAISESHGYDQDEQEGIIEGEYTVVASSRAS